jgi:hypothetical protein
MAVSTNQKTTVSPLQRWWFQELRFEKRQNKTISILGLTKTAMGLQKDTRESF